MTCDACAIGGKGCNNPIYKTIMDGCGRSLSYCKMAWEPELESWKEAGERCKN